MAPTIDFKKLLSKTGYGAERARQQREENEARQRAEDSPKNILLNPLDVAGEFDFERALTTTLGGVRRPITLDDLKQFEKYAKALGKRFVKKGITARAVIDFSNEADRRRSNSQISVAPLVRAKDGLLQFVTNVGPDSEFTRHHVRVRFAAFNAFAASPIKDHTRLAKALVAGPLQFDCSCPRHRYVFRYIATTGGFNIGPPLGRAEYAFPKVTNPKLEGIACKHALRVMQQIVRGTAVVPAVAQMLQQAHKKLPADVRITPTQAQAQAQAERQLRERSWKRNLVETTGQRAQRLSTTTAAKTRALVAATTKARQQMNVEVAAARADLAAAFRKMGTMGLPAAIVKSMREAAAKEFQKQHGVEL